MDRYTSAVDGNLAADGEFGETGVLLPWLLTTPLPFLQGALANRIFGPITRETPTQEIRLRNGIATVILAIPTFFAWRASLHPSTSTGLKIAAGASGTFWALATLLSVFATFSKSPFVRRGRTDLDKVVQKIPQWVGQTMR